MLRKCSFTFKNENIQECSQQKKSLQMLHSCNKYDQSFFSSALLNAACRSTMYRCAPLTGTQSKQCTSQLKSCVPFLWPSPTERGRCSVVFSVAFLSFRNLNFTPRKQPLHLQSMGQKNWPIHLIHHFYLPAILRKSPSCSRQTELLEETVRRCWKPEQKY